MFRDSPGSPLGRRLEKKDVTRAIHGGFGSDRTASVTPERRPIGTVYTRVRPPIPRLTTATQPVSRVRGRVGHRHPPLGGPMEVSLGYDSASVQIWRAAFPDLSRERTEATGGVRWWREVRTGPKSSTEERISLLEGVVRVISVSPERVWGGGGRTLSEVMGRT